MLTDGEFEREEKGREDIWNLNAQYEKELGVALLTRPTRATDGSKTAPTRPLRPTSEEMEATAEYLAFLQSKAPAPGKPLATISDGRVDVYARNDTTPTDFLQPACSTQPPKPRCFQSVVREAFKAKVRLPTTKGAPKGSSEQPSAKNYAFEQPGQRPKKGPNQPQSALKEPLPPVPPPPARKSTTSRNSDESFGCIDGLKNPEGADQGATLRAGNDQSMAQRLKKMASRVHLSRD
jgi:hypothetical protein